MKHGTLRSVICLVSISSGLADVTYVDATISNVTRYDGSVFNPAAGTGQGSTVDDDWRRRTDYATPWSLYSPPKQKAA